MPPLHNPRHERFAQELAKGKKADEAYKTAGYKPDRGHASRLASNGSVSDRVAELQGKAAAKVGVTVERVLEEMARIAFADITSAVEWGEALAVKNADGDEYAVQGVVVKPSENLPPEVSAAISEIAKTKDGIRIKFHDKQAALLNLGKNLGLFKDRVEHSGTVSLAEALDSLKGRSA